MKYQVISSDNYGAAGIKTMFFPGGEPHCHIDLKDQKSPILLDLRLRTWNDVGLAWCVMDALDRLRLHAKVFCPYYPGARQDHPILGTPATLLLMDQLVGVTDHGYIGPVHVFDVHNPAEFLGVKNWMPADLDIPIKDDVVGIIAPDHGAIDRATAFRDKFYPKAGRYIGTKVREQETGKIKSFTLPMLPAGPGRYIIVDDICDGGWTFNMLAQQFAEYYGTKYHLELFVSHGIFSKGLINLHPRIEHITTTDSFLWTNSRSGPRLTIVPLSPLYDRIMEVK